MPVRQVLQQAHAMAKASEGDPPSALAVVSCLPAKADFDYADIPVVASKVLRTQAARIRGLVKTTMSTIVDVGKELIDAKGNLNHGQFQKWVESECGFSVRTAENYIKAAGFCDGKNATVAFLNPGTVYKLAAKGTPPQVISEVMERVGKGIAVSDREVVDAIAKAKLQKKEAERKAKPSAPARRPASKRTRDRWEAEHVAEQKRKEAAEARQQELSLFIMEKLGPDVARHLFVEMRDVHDWLAVRLTLGRLLKIKGC